MPSRAKTVASRSPASGSSSGSSRSAPSATVTSLPNRAKTWPSSTPIAPPPSTTRDPGTCSVSIASRLVQKGVPARPGIGGTAGAVPAAMTTARWARSTCSPPADRATVTSPGAVIRPRPRTRMPPLPVNRSAATVSCQSSVASLRIRWATGAQSGPIRAVPAMPSIRRPSVSRLPARIIILEGTQPQYGHSPPTSRSSKPATARPDSASRLAAYSPPGPIPMTTMLTSRPCPAICPPTACCRRPRV